MLGEIEPVYRGPYLIEVFNAIPPLRRRDADGASALLAAR